VSTRTNIKLDEVKLPEDSFTETLNTLDIKKVDSIPIVFTGNDHIDRFINSLKLTGKTEKKTYRALLKFLRENSDNIKPLGDIDLTPMLTHKEQQAIDLLSEQKKPNLAAPSLMKIERYAGFTSTEEFYTAKNVGLRISPDIWVISLLGVYSSFITGTRYAGSSKDNYYFIFFSPEEILSMFAKGDTGYIYTLMKAKNDVVGILAELLKQTHMEEALALELVTNIELIKILRENDINKLSLSLVKISPEGQTYKIYEYIPLYLNSETPFIDLLSKFFSETDNALKYLASAIDPRHYLLRATSAKEAKNWPEKDHAIKAVLALYRLVSLNDASGLRDYANYLRLASDALRGSKDKKSITRQNYYEYLLMQLAALR
jgi:hypothetical protein